MDIVYATKEYFVTKDYDGSKVWYQLWETNAKEWFDTAQNLNEAIDKIWELEH